MHARNWNAQTLEKPKVSIAVGGKNLFYYLPLTVAEQLGYFRDEGLQVEISDFAGGAKALQFPVERTRGWYDLAVSVQGDPQFEYRYAGHLENGEASISDPGMGGLI